MTEENSTLSDTSPITLASQQIRAIELAVAEVVVGQHSVVRQLLIALLAGGHVLLEGVPGLGKTLMVKALARCFSAQFSRVQFTPDLMPTDITGHAMYNMKTESFTIRKGPAFTHLLLADEINRAPAKTQSALLEVMQEQQVTIEGKALDTPKPYMVLATQNPIEQEGTYPLPEAELDRFIMKLSISYPELEEEKQLAAMVTTGKQRDSLDVDKITPLASPEQVQQLQQICSNITIDPSVLDYAVRLARQTRQWQGIQRGAGPRASISLLRASRGLALINARDYVTPDDIKEVAPFVLRHRISLSADLEIEGISIDQVLNDLISQVEAPRQ